MTFAGQVVWITGASSGIGEALAYAFAREGARVVLSSRRVEELHRVRAGCTQPSAHLIAPLDLAQSETFPSIVEDVVRQTSRLDLLINNGGIGQRALATDATLEIERAIMEVDYFAPVALTKAVVPVMRAQRSGHLAVISSVMGYVGLPGRSTYAAAKHALHGYFDSLRAEVWRDQISVSIVCPGYVQTAISLNAVGPRGERHNQVDANTARGITPEKCAATILQGLARRREEIHVGGREVAAIYLKRFAPWLLSRLVRRMKFPASPKR